MGTRPDATVELDGAAILANARALEPLLRDNAEAIERERRLVPAVVDALRTAGVFRMSMPRSWGGPELGLPEQVEIVGAVSRANGSAGWCVMIGSDSGFYSANLPDDVGREIWPDLDAVTAGWLFPVGRLDREPGGDGDGGGYRLSGRWSFASGCTHADVLVAGALVWEGASEDGDDGDPGGDGGDGAPVLGPDGLPEWRVAVVPDGAAEILDTWHTTGLAGSGSHDYEVAGCHVPADRTWAFGGPPQRDGPLYAWPGAFLPNILGVPLGIARDAIDTAVPLLAAKLVMPDMTFAREDPRVRTAVARAEAQVGSARSYAYDVVGAFWDTLLAGDEPDLDSRAALAGCYVHVFQTCRASVQALYDIVGSAAVYRSCPLDQHLRDMSTVGQHILAQAKLFDAAGALWFGDDPGNPLL